MANITLPVPGESPNWGTTLNTAILRINQELESLGVRVSVAESGLSSVTLRVTNLEGQVINLRGRVTNLEDNLEAEIIRIAGDIIASDPAIQAAAIAALEDAIDELGLVDGEAEYTPAFGEGEDVAWGLVDAEEKRLPIELDKAGHWSQLMRRIAVEDTHEQMAEAIGISKTQQELFGVGAEIVDNSGKLLMRWDTAGHIDFPNFAVDGGGSAGDGSQAAVPNAINEWWVEPYEVWHEDRLIFGGVTTQGKALLCEWKPGTPARSVIIGDAIVDDHCASTPLVLGDGSVVGMWTNHNLDNFLRLAWGTADGSIDSAAVGIKATRDIGGRASYTQAHVITGLSDETKTVVWVFMRRNSYAWGYQPVTFNHTARTITYSAFVPVWSSEVTARQSYITTAPAYGAGDQTIRVAAYYNPAVAEGGPIWTFDINVASGAITSVDGKVTGTLGTPVTDAEDPSLTPLATTLNRRLFYVGAGPLGHAFAYAEGAISTPDSWSYKLAEWDGTTWQVSDFGIAGPRVGYTAAPNYLAGMALPSPRYDRIVTLARMGGSGSTVEVWRHDGTSWQAKTVKTGTKLARPRMTRMGVLYADISYYGSSYTNYSATMRTAQEGRN